MEYSKKKSTQKKKQNSVASQVDQTGGTFNSTETKTDPVADMYNQIVEALSGFNGWKLPPLNHRIDPSNDRSKK